MIVRRHRGVQRRIIRDAQIAAEPMNGSGEWH
jgi:hypothetical protein